MENNKLVTVTQLPLDQIMSIGKAFADSGMFADTKLAAQAIVKIQAGQEIGIPPFAAMTGIHIIQGKPTIGAGLIASRVKGSGKYDYKVIEASVNNCSIDFYQGKEKIGNSSFSIEDAKKAGTKNIDKFPKNMLFARTISNGVKWFCPDVFSGPVYVPEEMGMDITENISHVEIQEATVIPELFKTLDEKIEDAKTILNTASCLLELGYKWDNIGKEMRLQQPCLELKEKLKETLTPIPNA